MKTLYENNYYRLVKDSSGKLYRFDRIFLTSQEIVDKRAFASNLWYATQDAYKNYEITKGNLDAVEKLLSSDDFQFFTPKSEK